MYSFYVTEMRSLILKIEDKNRLVVCNNASASAADDMKIPDKKCCFLNMRKENLDEKI